MRALQVRQAWPLALSQNGLNGMGLYVPVPAVNPQVTRMVIYGAVGLVAVAVAFYLWNRR